MGLIDGLTGKVLKHNQIKENGAKFLLACAEKYSYGSFLKDYYNTLSALYLNYCYYLYESASTPSYKRNIKRVNFEYMMKYMVSIVTCELCHKVNFEQILNKHNLNITNFVEIVLKDCDFTINEKEMFAGFAANYKNENELLRNSNYVGYSKSFYEKAISDFLLVEENLAVVFANSYLIEWFFSIYEGFSKSYTQQCHKRI